MLCGETSLAVNSRESTLCLSPMEGLSTQNVSTEKIREGDELYGACSTQEQPTTHLPPRFLLRRPRDSSKKSLTSLTSLTAEQSPDEPEMHRSHTDHLQPNSLDDEQGSTVSVFSTTQGEKVTPPLTLEEREQAYEEARRRIFGNFKNSEGTDNASFNLKDVSSSSYRVGPPRPARPRPFRIPHGHLCGGGGKNMYPLLPGRQTHVKPRNGLFVPPSCATLTNMTSYASSPVASLWSFNPPLRYDAYPYRGSQAASFRPLQPSHCSTLVMETPENPNTFCSPPFYSSDLNVNEYSQQFFLDNQDSLDRVHVMTNQEQHMCGDGCQNAAKDFSFQQRDPRKDFWPHQPMQQVKKETLVKGIQRSYDVEFPPLE